MLGRGRVQTPLLAWTWLTWPGSQTGWLRACLQGGGLWRALAGGRSVALALLRYPPRYLLRELPMIAVRRCRGLGGEIGLPDFPSVCRVRSACAGLG